MKVLRVIAAVFARLAWELEGKPKTKAVPVYHNHKLVAYDEFLLNQIGEVYIEIFDGEYKSIRRRIYLFDTKVLVEKEEAKP